MKTNLLLCLLLLPFLALAQDKGASAGATQSLRPKATTRAVVVGISDYQDPNISDLQFADKDASAFASWLQASAGGTVPADNIKLLTNKAATTGAIAAAMDWLIADSKKGDQAVIYFSGHGDVETLTRFQRGFLLTYDSPPNNYMAGAFALIFLQDIISTLSEQGVQVLMISDACRAGKLAGSEIGGAQATAANLSKQFANEIKILSCQPNEFSLEGVQWGGGRGAFSYHLVNGLTGLADRNTDQLVNLLEINRYLEEIVPAETAPQMQIPMTVGSKGTVLAKVDAASLLALQQQTANQAPAISNIDTRGFEDVILSGADSSWQKKYKQFTAALEKDELLEPAGSSAYDLYQELVQVPELERLHGIMKRNLATALQDESQQAVNAYLAANPTELQRRFESEPDYGLYPRYLEKAGELLGAAHYYYSSLMAKKHYFEGLAIRMNADAGVENYSYQQAIEKQNKALAHQENAPYILNELGVLHTRLKSGKKAIEYYKKAIDLAPNWGLPYVNYCVESYYSGDNEKAREMGEKALEKMPDYPQMYNFLGWIYANYYSHIADKSNWSREGVELKGDFFYDWDNMGTLSQRKERFKRTIALLKKAIELDSNYLAALQNLGAVFNNIQEYESAIPYLTKAVALDTTDDYAQAMLGTAYSGIKNFEKGEEALQKAISLTIENQPKTAALWYNSLGGLYSSWKKPTLAIETYKKAIELRPTYPLPRLNLSTRYLIRKEYKLAEQYGLESISLDTLYPALYPNLGGIYQQLNRPADAEWMYLRALKLNPDYERTFNWLFNLYLKTKQYSKALVWVKKALEVNPEDLSLLVRMDILYFHLGELEKAKKYSGKVEGKLKYEGRQIRDVAYYYHRAQYYQKAIYYFKKNIEVEPNYDWNEYNISCGYALLGKSDQAIKWLSASLENGLDAYEHICSDSDLESIRGTLAFQALLKKHFPDRVYEEKPVIVKNTEPIYYPENTLLLAEFYENMGEWNRALDLYKEVTQLDPFVLNSTDSKTQFKIGKAFVFHKNGKQAAVHFEKSIAPDSLEYVNTLNVGAFYLLHDQFATAEKYIKKAHQLDPDKTPAIEWLATLHYAQDRKQEAHQLLNALIDKETRQDRVYFQKAFFHLQSGEPDQAKIVLRKIQKQYPEYSLVLDFLEHAGKQDYESATTFYLEFITRFSWWQGRAYFDYLYCEMNIRQGKLEAALEVFEKMLKSISDYPTMTYQMLHTDPDLAPLKKYKRYAELMNRYFPEKM